MNQENFKLLNNALNDQTLTDDQRRLECIRITSNKVLPPVEFLFRVFGTPCFPLGEIVAVTGKAKSGKTLLNSLLMACCTLDKALHFERPVPEDSKDWISKPRKCLWFDTEQSEQSTQEILVKRVLKMTEKLTHAELEFSNEKYYDVFNARSLRCDERLSLFKTAVYQCHPDLVILDGVRDLITDINDGVKAQLLVEELMSLAQETRSCIVCVLHQNKGAEDRNPRGWLGTELMNKAFEVYSCEKVKPENIFVVEQTLTRKYDWEKVIGFRIDPKSELPVMAEPPVGCHYNFNSSFHDKKGGLPPMNPEYTYFDEKNDIHVKMKELFYEVLKVGPMFYNDLQTKAQNLLGCTTGYWNNLFGEARNAGIIVNGKDEHNRSIWMLPKKEQATQLDLYEKSPS